MKKSFAILLCLCLLLLTACTTPIDQQTSPDGLYTVTLQDCSGLTPGNELRGKLLLQSAGKTLASAEESFWYGPSGDAELALGKHSWSVAWEDGQVVIMLYGLYHPRSGTRTIEWELP